MDADDSTGQTVDRIQLPRRIGSPVTQVTRRVVFALALVLFVAVVVRLGRDGYVDASGDEISLLDALYYASVTVTTTGYGDITPITGGARLATILLITPARIVFLILVVGTTVEVLTDQSRMLMAARRWRRSVKDHYIVCGYGATGQAAVRNLLERGIPGERIVAVDVDPDAVELANSHGLVAVLGDASRSEVLNEAGIESADSVIVVPNRDDTAVLITLTSRELSDRVHIVAGGREQENLHLLRQGGADEVIDATAALGRMLGLGACAPGAGHVVADLLDAGGGLELIEFAPSSIPDGANVIAVIRDGRHHLPGTIDMATLGSTDRVVVLTTVT